MLLLHVKLMLPPADALIQTLCLSVSGRDVSDLLGEKSFLQSIVSFVRKWHLKAQFVWKSYMLNGLSVSIVLWVEEFEGIKRVALFPLLWDYMAL